MHQRVSYERLEIKSMVCLYNAINTFCCIILGFLIKNCICSSTLKGKKQIFTILRPYKTTVRNCSTVDIFLYI